MSDIDSRLIDYSEQYKKEPEPVKVKLPETKDQEVKIKNQGLNITVK